MAKIKYDKRNEGRKNRMFRVRKKTIKTAGK